MYKFIIITEEDYKIVEAEELRYRKDYIACVNTDGELLEFNKGKWQVLDYNETRELVIVLSKECSALDVAIVLAKVAAPRSYDKD